MRLKYVLWLQIDLPMKGGKMALLKVKVADLWIRLLLMNLIFHPGNTKK